MSTQSTLDRGSIARSAAACLAFSLLLGGCASSNNSEGEAARFIADMDGRPAEKRVPNWDQTRARMLREAPAVGEAAPDFTLETREGDGTIRLSEFQPGRPVVLIFGSWT